MLANDMIKGRERERERERNRTD